MMAVTGPWDVNNVRNLMADIGKNDTFSIDISGLEWRPYCIGYVIGIKKHLLMQPLSAKELAKQREIVER
jgi:hypothetical protein